MTSFKYISMLWIEHSRNKRKCMQIPGHLCSLAGLQCSRDGKRKGTKQTMFRGEITIATRWYLFSTRADVRMHLTCTFSKEAKTESVVTTLFHALSTSCIPTLAILIFVRVAIKQCMLHLLLTKKDIARLSMFIRSVYVS